MKNINDLLRLETVRAVLVELNNHYDEYDFKQAIDENLKIANPLVKRLIDVLLPYLKNENPQQTQNFTTLKYIKVSDFWPGRTDDSSEFASFYHQLRFCTRLPQESISESFETVDVLNEFLILETFQTMTASKLCEVIKGLETLSQQQDQFDQKMIKKLFSDDAHYSYDSSADRVAEKLSKSVSAFSSRVTANFNTLLQQSQYQFFQAQLEILLWGFKLKLIDLLKTCDLASFIYLLLATKDFVLDKNALTNRSVIRQILLRGLSQYSETLLKNLDDFVAIAATLDAREMFYLNKITDKSIIALAKGEQSTAKLATVLKFKNETDQLKFITSIEKDDYIVLFKNANDINFINDALKTDILKQSFQSKIKSTLGYKEVTTSVNDYNLLMKQFGSNSAYAQEMAPIKLRFDQFNNEIQGKTIQHSNPNEILWKLACSTGETEDIITSLKNAFATTSYLGSMFKVAGNNTNAIPLDLSEENNLIGQLKGSKLNSFK
jgi:hypothetical protein